MGTGRKDRMLRMNDPHDRGRRDPKNVYTNGKRVEVIGVTGCDATRCLHLCPTRRQKKETWGMREVLPEFWLSDGKQMRPKNTHIDCESTKSKKVRQSMGGEGTHLENERHFRKSTPGGACQPSPPPLHTPVRWWSPNPRHWGKEVHRSGPVESTASMGY